MISFPDLKLDKKFITACLMLAFPVIIQNLVVFGNDNLLVAILGTLSDKAISGYTIANESYSIYYMIALGLSGGFHVYISQLYASKNYTKCNQILRMGTKLIILIGLVFSSFFFFFAKPFVNIFISDPQMVEYAVQYLRIYSWSLLFYGINVMWAEMFTYIGSAKFSFFGSCIECLTTLVSTLLFVKVLDYGIAGVALGILLGRIVQTIYLFILINWKDSKFKFSVKYPKLDGNEIVKIIKISLPLIANETLYSIAFMFIVKNFSFIDERKIACYTVVNNSKKLFFTVNYALHPAVASLIGKNLGVGNYDEAIEHSNDILVIILYFQIIFSSIMFALSNVIPGWFSLQGEIAQICSKMLRAEALYGIFVVYQNITYVILKIGADTKHVFILDGLFSFLCPMVLTFICAYFLKTSFYVTWILFEGTYILKAAIGLFFYFKGTWIRRLS